MMVDSLNKPIVKHGEDSGAFCINNDPLRDKNKDELTEDVEILKERLKGKWSSSLDEQ